MRIPTPNEIETALGLKPNTLSITFLSDASIQFDPELSIEDNKIAMKLLLQGVDDNWEATSIFPERWEEFNFYWFNEPSFINYGCVVREVNPYVVPVLINQYNKVASEGVDLFARYYNYFCQLGDVSPEHCNDWAAMAKVCNLPSDFISVIQG